MADESVEAFYDREYRLHRTQVTACSKSVHDLAKAQRRVERVLRGFGLEQCGPGATVLDVGSGLGYYTKALAATGADVTGLDFSKTAIEVASATFPDCRFQHGAWPTDVARAPKFDLIWTVNFSFINTFDVEFIATQFIAEAVQRLTPTGALVLGWNSDFSGRSIGGYSHWSLRMLRRLQQACHLSAPLVAEARTARLSWCLIRAAYVSRRSIPFFMVFRNRGTVSRVRGSATEPLESPAT